MTELEHAIKHIKTRADAWAVKEVTEALQSISERLDKALSQEPMLEKIFNIVHPLSIMSTDKLEHEAIMQIAEMLEPLYLLESEEQTE